MTLFKWALVAAFMVLVLLVGHALKTTFQVSIGAGGYVVLAVVILFVVLWRISADR